MEDDIYGEGFRTETPTTISTMPIDINLSGITLDAHEPLLNAYHIADRYPGIKIIEGLY